MFSKELKVMLYVDDVAAAAHFWQKVGFLEVSREEMEGTLIVEVTPHEDATTSFMLYDRQFVLQHDPEAAAGNPAIMFTTPNALALYEKMKAEHVELGELLQLPDGLVFNFMDSDGNYFAVSEGE